MYIKKPTRIIKNVIFNKKEVETNLKKIVGDKLYLNNAISINLANAFMEDIKSLHICMITNEEELMTGVGKSRSLSVFNGVRNGARSSIASKITSNSLINLQLGLSSAIAKHLRPTIAFCDLSRHYDKYNLTKTDIEHENLRRKIGTRKEQTFNIRVNNDSSDDAINHPGIQKQQKKRRN